MFSASAPNKSLTSRPFNVAVLADVHGNLHALEAVLTDVNRHAPDGVVFAGDLMMNGPHPTEVLSTVKRSGNPVVTGNTDDEVIEGTDAVARWTQERVGAEGVAYLKALPLSHRMTPPDGTSPTDDLLVVHATPRSCCDLLILEPHPLGTTFTRPTPVDEAATMLNGERAGLIVCGHIHYASAGLIGSQSVMSVGSVGFPFDGDRRAAYALAVWDGRGWGLEHCRVAYDVEAAIRDLERSTMPFRNRYVKMLREANWFPREQPVI